MLAAVRRPAPTRRLPTSSGALRGASGAHSTVTEAACGVASGPTVSRYGTEPKRDIVPASSGSGTAMDIAAVSIPSVRPLDGADLLPPGGELRVAPPALVDVAQLHRLQARPDLSGRAVGLQLLGGEETGQAPVVELEGRIGVEAAHPFRQLRHGSDDALVHPPLLQDVPGALQTGDGQGELGLVPHPDRAALTGAPGGADPGDAALGGEDPLGVVEGREPAERDVPGGRRHVV